MEINRNKVASSLFWKFFERIGSQLATFILGIVLARLLSPTEYGTIALVTVFISIATVFVQGGFNTALIQKKEAEDCDYKSVLWFSLAIAVILYAALFFAATPIARFYENDSLILIVRVLSLTLFPGAVNSIQVAFITKQMQFKKLFIANFVSVIIGGVAGVVLAICGFGVWAIVAQQLSVQVFNCIMAALLAPMRLKGKFSTQAIKNLIPFGSRVLASNLLVAVFLDIRSLIIGKKYSTEDLAFFNRGKTFTSTAMDAVNGSLQSVMLPTFSIYQNDIGKLLSILRKTIKIGAFVVFPCLCGLAAVATPLVKILLTDKWLPCVRFLQIFAIASMAHPMQNTSSEALKAIGKSNVTFRIEIIRKTFEIVCLLVALHFGVTAIAVSSLVANTFSWLVCLYPNKKYLGYTVTQQIKDVSYPFIVSVVMFGIVSAVVKVLNNVWLQLIVGICVGVTVYILVAVATRNETYRYIFDFLKQRLKKSNGESN